MLERSGSDANPSSDVQLTLSRTNGTIHEAVAAGWSGYPLGIAEGKRVREALSGPPHGADRRPPLYMAG